MIKKNVDKDDKHTILIEDNLTSAKKRSHIKQEDTIPRQRSIASLVENSSYHNEQGVISRRVVGAAHFLDSVSTITGKYLRHYPLARLVSFSI